MQHIAGRVWTGDGFTAGELTTDGEKVAEFRPDEGCDNGKYVIPGCVDIHTHGCLGFDFSCAEIPEARRMLRRYLRRGVTTVVPTLITDFPENMIRAAGRIRELCSSHGGDEAKIAGIHLEGPFIGEKKRGAHNPLALMPPSQALFDELEEASGGMIRTITLDPSLPGADEFIGRNSDRVKISLGHTDCGYERAEQAFSLGAGRVTHLFNAMRGIHHREPGLIGAAADSGAWAELICDGFHVHPSAVRMAFGIFGGRIVLISDSICAAGAPDGVYEMAGLRVLVKNGRALLEDGTIAGSSATLTGCLKKAVSFGISPAAAVRAACGNPALALGLEGAGRLDAGAQADILTLDGSFNLLEVYANGRSVSCDGND